MENQMSEASIQKMYDSKKASKTKMWLLFLFFGWSYGSFGSIGKQIMFYMTAGGFGVWAFYVLFTLNGKIKQHNTKAAVMLGMDTKQMIANGLI